MKFFVCSDIHGFYDEWMDALNKSGFDINNKKHKIIICGDLFDRGHQPKQIIDFILSHKDKFVLIRGNHEDLMEQMIKRNIPNYNDLCNGTAGTILDLYPNWTQGKFKFSQDEIKKHYLDIFEYFRNINRLGGNLEEKYDLSKIAKDTKLQDVIDMTVDYFETKRYIFVHGWIPHKDELIIKNNSYVQDFTYIKDWRNANEREWNDARWTNPVDMYKNKIFEPNKVIVCGHWHCSALWNAFNPNKYNEFGGKANFEPFVTKNMMAIDACTAYSHKVNVKVIEDEFLDKKVQINEDEFCM